MCRRYQAHGLDRIRNEHHIGGWHRAAWREAPVRLARYLRCDVRPSAPRDAVFTAGRRQSVTGPEAFFQASIPPWMWHAEDNPASWAACTAIAERSPKAQ